MCRNAQTDVCVGGRARVSNLTAVRACLESLLLEYQQQVGNFHTDEVALKQFELSDWKLRQVIKLHRMLTLPPLAHSIAHYNLLLVGSIGSRLTLLVRLALFLTGAGLAASGIEKPIHPVFINVSTKATPFDQFRTLLTEDRKIAIVCTVCAYVLYFTVHSSLSIHSYEYICTNSPFASCEHNRSILSSSYEVLPRVRCRRGSSVITRRSSTSSTRCLCTATVHTCSRSRSSRILFRWCLQPLLTSSVESFSYYFVYTIIRLLLFDVNPLDYSAYNQEREPRLPERPTRIHSLSNETQSLHYSLHHSIPSASPQFFEPLSRRVGVLFSTHIY